MHIISDGKKSPQPKYLIKKNSRGSSQSALPYADHARRIMRSLKKKILLPVVVASERYINVLMMMIRNQKNKNKSYTRLPTSGFSGPNFYGNRKKCAYEIRASILTRPLYIYRYPTALRVLFFYLKNFLCNSDLSMSFGWVFVFVRFFFKCLICRVRCLYCDPE